MSMAFSLQGPVPVTISEFTGVPIGMIQAEMDGIYGTQLLEDLARIIRYYEIYEYGARFFCDDTKGDYIHADLPYMRSAILIDKQARFVFGKPAEFTIGPDNPEDDSEATREAVSTLQDLIDAVFKHNNLADKCLKGFKDACIGERVGITIDFNEQGVFIKFHPSYSFVYKVDEYERLTRYTVFYTSVDSIDKNQQRIHRKKWELNEDGFCVITEDVFDGTGRRLEQESEDPIVTPFTHLPCYVVLNDGLTGDLDGESEIRRLAEYEAWYSKLSNADIDAGRQGMNPVRWARDMTPESTENLPISAGAFWDLSSNKEIDDSVVGEVGVLESRLDYSDTLSKTLDRLSTTMNETVDVPNISADSMSGTITSGKTLRAIYWPLTMRSDEKMIAWVPALEFIADTVIEGTRIYKDSAIPYLGNEPVPLVEYALEVTNPYSLPDDEAEEKALDMTAVGNQTMSRKKYIIKWQQCTDKEADQELRQIAFENELFNNASILGGGAVDWDSAFEREVAGNAADAVTQDLNDV